jgi:hypothetical protein
MWTWGATVSDAFDVARSAEALQRKRLRGAVAIEVADQVGVDDADLADRDVRSRLRMREVPADRDRDPAVPRIATAGIGDDLLGQAVRTRSAPSS